MKGRALEIAALGSLVALLIVAALASAGRPPSTYSSLDTGPNGYRAIYGVLERERVPVRRLEAPLGRLDRRAGVLVLTPSLPAFGTQLPILLDAADLARIESFVKRGGNVLAFGTVRGLKKSPRVHRLDVAAYTNAALARSPRNALDVYRLVAGRGPVVFDEQLHGYDRTRSLWSVLPVPVHAAVWIAAMAALLGAIGANVPFAPPIPQEPPAGRDSSDYLRSMARLLRRARGGHAAVERFARALPHDTDLAVLAANPRPSDAQVLRAASIYAARRKDHV